MNIKLIIALFTIPIDLILSDLTKSSSINYSYVVSNNTNNIDNVENTETESLGKKEASPSTIKTEGWYNATV